MNSFSYAKKTARYIAAVTFASLFLHPYALSAQRADTSEVLLTLHGTTNVPGASLHWAGVADSRCPIQHKCITQGRVTIDIVVASGLTTLTHHKLSLGARPEDSYFVINKIKVQLLRVTPKADSRAMQYMAALHITRL